MAETETINATKATSRRRSKNNVPPDALLEKKRATDRQSQRVVRDRTKKYIAHLENLVEVLQKNQEDERLTLMTAQCNRLRDENEQLRNAMLSITRAIQGVEKLDLVKTNFTEAQNALALPDRHSMSVPPYASPSFSDGQSPVHTLPKQPFIPFDFPFNSVPSPPVEPSDKAFSYPSPETEDAHVFVVISNLLRQAEHCNILSMDLDKDADIVIRSIAHGWPHVEQCCQLDPAWRILRRIDEEVMICCGPVERLAILRTVRLKLLQHKISSSEQQVQEKLPQYMHSKPIQTTSDHLSLIDYFVWPELREYLLNKTNIDLSNKTAAAFASGLRFLWPYELSDTWIRNTETGLYSFSKLFEESLNNVSSWAMSAEFFDSYPHMIGYIPTPGSDNVDDAVSQSLEDVVLSV